MENLVVSTRKKINMETFFTSVKISTESVISKVLSHSTRIGIAGVESVNGGISITGRVFVDLVYLTAAGEIEHAEGFIDVDCGCGGVIPGARLACLRLDDMKEFYV